MLLMVIPYCFEHLTYIINLALQNNTFPSMWKESLVTPIPKSSNPRALNDLCSTSLLPFLSKKICETQLHVYLDQHELLPTYQIGFRPRHSTITALLNLSFDVLEAFDYKKISAILLLDYSKAFDSLNHELLLCKLRRLNL